MDAQDALAPVVQTDFVKAVFDDIHAGRAVCAWRRTECDSDV